MSLVSVQNLTIGFRGPLLLHEVSFRIERGERIGLLGRNGSGKSTLLRLLLGQVEPDGGQVSFETGARLAMLPQDIPPGLAGSVHDLVAAGSILTPPSQGEEDWRTEQRVTQVLSRMDLDGAAAFGALSSGMKRRVLLARALATAPDLLLLDEPTNHLDMTAIEWLEGVLLRSTTTLLFVTHDRTFLRRISRRILEIDRGALLDWTCDYDTFLDRKEAALLAQERQEAEFDKKLAQEEVWIRQGVKARRTRNQGRVRALEEMRRERRERSSAVGTARIEIQRSQRGGAIVVEAEHLDFAYAERSILSDFSVLILRGDKIGIVGPNGAGKTTLLKILVGQLEPHGGTIRHGAGLQVAYFDQLREQLDEEKTVIDNVTDGTTHVQLGDRSRHAISYLQDFLFPPERARSLVRDLSGGERNRLLLARLFSRPANLLVLDEPTNDLDTETLELLESRLVEFPGTVLIVSHDRTFLNHVATSLIVVDEQGVREFVGSYDEWQKQQQPAAAGAAAVAPERKAAAAPKPARLTYQERRELDQLPARIEAEEAAVTRLHELMSRPDFYQQGGAEITERQAELKECEARLADAYRRWEELEQRTG